MRTISALFDSYDHAARAVRSLKDAGIPSEDISLVANNADGLIHEEGHADSETNAPKGAGLGAATGAGVGLLAGLGQAQERFCQRQHDARAPERNRLVKLDRGQSGHPLGPGNQGVHRL